MNVRPLGDQVLVLCDTIPQNDGMIILPHGNRVRTGTVHAVGPGRPSKRGRAPVEVKEGERIAFFREHLEHRQGKEIVHRLAELDGDWGLLREEDILFVVPADWKGALSA